MKLFSQRNKQKKRGGKKHPYELWNSTKRKNLCNVEALEFEERRKDQKAYLKYNG